MKPFRLRLSDDGQYYFVHVAKNNKVLSTSETYTRKTRCIDGILAAINTIMDAIGLKAMTKPTADLYYEDETVTA